MWARIAELLLAIWLMISYRFFDYSTMPCLRTNDWICAGFIVLFALLSFREKWNKMHLCTLAVAFWMVGVVFSQPTAPALENHLIIALLLSMIALVPSHATRPPRSWVEFYKNN